MHEYKLTLSVKEIDETASISGQFKDEDWERLEAFVQYAGELLKTRFVQDGMFSSLNVRWEKESGMKIFTELPPWDDVTVFLHKFRPVGLQSESTYFYSICSILTKEIDHPYFRSMVQEQREIYSGRALQAQFQIKSNDVVLNSEKVLYDWLNAFEYHRDKERREFIESLHTMLPLEASKVLFIALLTEKVQAIHNIALLVQVVVGKQKRLDGIVKPPS